MRIYVHFILTYFIRGQNYEFLGFAAVAEVSILLCYDPLSLDNWFLMLQDNTVISSSRVEVSNRIFLGVLTLEVRVLHCLKMGETSYPL
jgi:hypothetical protein